jgi:hypothetical protein
MRTLRRPLFSIAVALLVALCTSAPSAAAAAPAECEWTDWLNRDSPKGAGDVESLADFVAEEKACAEPQQVECRTTNGRPADETGEVVTCTPESGSLCLHRQQAEGVFCSDYEVRFCC